MRKILIITGSLPPMKCGVGYYTAYLLESLIDREDLAVLTTAPSDVLEKNIEIIPVKGWRLRDLPSLVVACKKSGADIIHMQYPTTGYKRHLGINLLPWLLRLFVHESKLVITLHEYFSSPLLGRIRNLVTVSSAKLVIVSNEADRHALPSFLRGRIRVIPIGSSIETDVPNIKAAEELLANQRGAATILFFGFAFQSKRLELLIAAMKQLKDKQLIIASDLNPEDLYDFGLIKQINAHNVALGYEQIRVVGFQPSEILTALLQKSFCFVLPQNTPLNTKSSSVVAALRCLTPIIGKQGNLWENQPLIDKKNSLLLDRVTQDSIVEAVNALDDIELRSNVKAGMAHIASAYSWQSISDIHHALYSELTK